MKIFKDIEYLEIVKVQLTSYFASRKTYFEFEQKQKFIKILIFDKKQKKKRLFEFREFDDFSTNFYRSKNQVSTHLYSTLLKNIVM